MAIIKINEQIAGLRKQKGMTQEEMANVLGVTNQAVSKWESAACCPDIQLLPEIAGLFDVSVDELLGCDSAQIKKSPNGTEPVRISEDIISSIREKINLLPRGEDFNFIFQLAAALHVLIWSKEITKQPDEELKNAMEHAGNAEWGYSSLNIPELTTTMRNGTVLFSNNKSINLTKKDISRIVSVIKPFGNTENLKIASALYDLTFDSEDKFATADKISGKSGLPSEKVRDCLTGEMAAFVLEKEDAEGEFRFNGMYMNIIPIISLFCF